ncbi:hypothetical protein ACS0TY_017034 [Phlomoides rotata]
MDATKINRGRNKVFACFKPVVDEAASHEASPPFSADDVASPRKRKLRRSFSAALKAVLFKTSLKKCRSENSKHESYKLRNSFFSKSKKVVKSVKKNIPCTPSEPVHIFRTNSDRSSLFSSNSSSKAPSLSSSASSCSSHSRSGSADKIKRSISMDFKQLNKQKTTRNDCGRKSCSDYNLNIEIFIVWACLFALVWGKVFAIVICTSSWLFFAPAHRCRPSQRPQPLRRLDSFDEIDPEYRKRVIMEGLLDRNR